MHDSSTSVSNLADRFYHEARVLEEKRRAEQSPDPVNARLHRELAALHRHKLMALADPAPAARPSIMPTLMAG